MGNPTSALGVTGWLALLVVIAISVWPTGKSVRDTLYYKYRPANMPIISPVITSIFWVAVLVLVDVSWVYLFTITSNTGSWVNHLFPNSKNPWDTMMSLYLVTVIFIKMWNPYVYFLDKLSFYAYGEFSFNTAATNVLGPSPNVPYNAAKRATGSDASIDVFWEKNRKYHTENYIVKVGMWVYALALIALTATITGFYSRQYTAQKNDHYYKVIYWTVFVALFAAVTGFIFVAASTVRAYRETDNKADMEKILARRLEENASG